jgi:DNA replication and repair protein RecF
MGIPSHLCLRRFRNYTELAVSFSPGINLIHGRNGQGKSNIIEAVCYLGLLRSFRTHRVASLRQWGASDFFISGAFTPIGDELPFTLSVEYGERRILRWNDQPVGRASEFINRFLCVPFVPEDIALIKGPAGGRRRFMDIVMAQIDSTYLVELQRYQIALRERNAMLRDPARYSASALHAYDRILARCGAGILAKRAVFQQDFNEVLGEVSSCLRPHGGGRFSLRYACGIPSIQALAAVGDAEREIRELTRVLLDHLHNGIEQDRREGSTRCGPHRADLTFLLDGRPLYLYGSEGECRLAALALRLGSVRLLSRTRTGMEHGITLLVDDVVGELDARHVASFLEALGRASQVLITCTEPSSELLRTAAAIFQVENGKVTRIS